MSVYGYIALFFVAAIGFGILPLVIAFLVRPRRPTAVKTATYECGLQTIGPSWVQFRVGFYLYALVFVIFDVETVFLYPWAVAYRQLGLFALVEMVIFVGILVVGLAYAWRKRALAWK